MGSEKPVLQNDGRLSLFFTGVGSSFSKHLFQTSLIIIKGNTHVMIDCGTLTPLVMDHIGLPVHKIDNLIVTHSHADHVGGLEEMSLVQRYMEKKKCNIIITEEFQNILWEQTLKGGIQYNEFSGKRFLEFEDMFNPIRPAKIRIFDRDGWHIRIGTIDLKLFRTMHVPDSAPSWKEAAWSTGVVIDDKILFTGDTRFDTDLYNHPDFLDNIEYIFHDCQLDFTGGVHASLEELKKLSPDIKSKTRLVHYGDNWPLFEEQVTEAGFAGFTQRWIYHDFI